MIAPRVVIDNRAVDAAFDRLLSMAGDPREGLNAVGRVVKAKIQIQFATGTDPYGRQWRPLKSRGGQPLRDKGLLMSSFDYAIEGHAVVIGTNLEYAPVHQFGATIRPKSSDPKARLRFMVNGKPVFAREVTIPPREMLPLDGLPPDWEQDIVAAMGDVVGARWQG